MKITIIPEDGAVYKDGVSYSNLDLSFVDASIHALQWTGSAGWIEFKENENGEKAQNEKITSLPNWVTDCLSLWDGAKIAEDEANRAKTISVVSDQSA